MRTEAAEPPKNKAPPAVTFEKLEYTLRRAVLQRPADFRRTPRETLLKALRVSRTPCRVLVGSGKISRILLFKSYRAREAHVIRTHVRIVKHPTIQVFSTDNKVVEARIDCKLPSGL